VIVTSFFSWIQGLFSAAPQSEGDPQQDVINKVGAARSGLHTAVRELDQAVKSDNEDGAKKGGRELKVLAQQAHDVSVQTTVLEARLKDEKTDPSTSD
jgi:hypothetical protein